MVVYQLKYGSQPRKATLHQSLSLLLALAWLKTTVPTKVPAAVPLAMVNAIAANSGSSVTSSLNQNPVLKGNGWWYSPSSVGWGNPLAQLVVAS